MKLRWAAVPFAIGAVHLAIAASSSGRIGARAALVVLLASQAAPGVVLLATAARHRGRMQRSQALFGLASLSSAGIFVVWLGVDIADPGAPVPFPSPADAAYVVAVVSLIAALATAPGGARDRRERLRLVLDGAVVATSMLIVAWPLVLGPAFEASSSSGLGRVLAVGYPLADIVSLTLAVVTLLRADAAQKGPTLVIAAGVLFYAIGDGLFAYLTASGQWTSAHPASVAWVVAAPLIALGAIAANGASSPVGAVVRATPARVVAFIANAPIPLAIVVALVDRDGRGFTVVVGLFLTFLVLVRQSLAVVGWVATAERSETRWQALVDNFSDCLTLVDEKGRILYDSPSVTRQLGFEPGSRVGKPGFEYIHPEDRAGVERAVLSLADRPGGHVVTESRVMHGDGSWHWTESTTTNMLHLPSVAAVVVNYRDVDERQAFQTELRRLAFQDALTGLANRARLSAELADGAHPEAPGLALLLLDLDGFKVVNDTLGHDAGDELLRVVAQRIRGLVGSSGLAVRLGGDEFAVLLRGATEDAAAALAARLLEVLRSPLSLKGRPVVVQGSVGISVTDDEVDADAVLAEADIAMYAAKAHGKGQYRVFEREMHEAAIARLRLGADLGDALERGLIRPHYQPIVDLDSGEVTGFEALARWDHPTRGFVPPLEFVALAEETGLILELGHAILVSATDQLREWQARFPRTPALTMSVNLSVSQFHHPELLPRILEVLESSGIAPGSLCLEVTESFMVDSEEVVSKLLRLREAGISLAIDDFGTGYSSFGYLRRLPVDIVKIDRSLVAGIAQEAEQWALVRAVVQLLHTLGLRSVAEGVEEAEQMAHLRTLGCDQAQGYFYAKPMAPEQAVALLRETARPPGEDEGSALPATGTSR